jgi:hypothetical protein
MPLRSFIDGPDDRQDDETRGRIREIQAGLLAWQARVDDRYRKVVWLVILAVVLSFIAVGGTLATAEAHGPFGDAERGCSVRACAVILRAA